MRRAARAAVTAVGAVAVVLIGTAPALAHPLGNFTVNQHAEIVVSPERIDLTRIVDLAEVPTVQARKAIDADGDGELAAAEVQSYAATECARLADGTELEVDSTPTTVTVARSSATLPPGQAGLPTLRVECALEADIGTVAAGTVVRYSGDGFPGRLGWREVVAVGDGVTLAESDVPDRSISGELTAYPEDLLSSPLEVTSAVLVLQPGGRRLDAARRVGDSGGLLPRGVDRLSLRLTDLVAEQDLTLGFGLLALSIAIGLGALHAASPGHGKTVMAAYLVGQRGTVRQAAVIGLTVTGTHTIGVVALGVVLTVSTAVAPDRVIPWLSVASGLLLAAVGVFLLRRAWRTRRAAVAARRAAVAHQHDHDHGHEHAHDHEHDEQHDHVHAHDADAADGWHEHGGTRHRHAPLDLDRPLHWRSLVALGFAGGLVPSPSALVVLLGAIALGRTWFGLLLVLGFGLGMAATLVAAGLLLERGRRFLDRRAGARTATSGRLPTVLRLLPVLTSAVVVVVGLSLATRGAAVALS